MRNKRDVAEFIVLVLREFAKAKNLEVPSAYEYLAKHKGINFLEVHYGFEHTLASEETIENLIKVCQNNGGTLTWKYTMVRMLK